MIFFFFFSKNDLFLKIELLNTGDNETVADAAWALSYLTDGDDSKIQVSCFV